MCVCVFVSVCCVRVCVYLCVFRGVCGIGLRVCCVRVCGVRVCGGVCVCGFTIIIIIIAIFIFIKLTSLRSPSG